MCSKCPEATTKWFCWCPLWVLIHKMTIVAKRTEITPQRTLRVYNASLILCLHHRSASLSVQGQWHLTLSMIATVAPQIAHYLMIQKPSLCLVHSSVLSLVTHLTWHSLVPPISVSNNASTGIPLPRRSICMTAVSKPVNFSENSIAFTGPVAYVLDLVYNFVKSALQCHGLPTFPIPQMWFVKAMLAILQDQHQEVYTIEEAIDETFMKYISNDNSCPLLQRDPGSEEIGEFLAFVQHVQYEKSGQMAFVADFQGEHIT